MPQIPDPIELLYAYSNGYFPMAHPEHDNMVYWHRPDKRGIIPLENFHVSKNLRRLYRNGPFEFAMNTAFDEVIRGCADRDTTWISDEIIRVYSQLHEMGHAHSFEVWRVGQLVGGLYGIRLKRAFFGESMFSRESNTSKLALVYLVDYMQSDDMTLLDTQYLNNHLKQFGAIEIPDDQYMELLEAALTDEQAGELSND